MKSRNYTLTFIGLLLIAITLGSCGERVHESVAYYSPNWMPDGRIICYKEVSKWSDALWGPRELGDKGSITIMDVDGSNEQDLFEIIGGYVEMVCSPVGEKIAVYTPNYNYGISVYDYRGNKSDILSGEGVDSADWSPDGRKLTYVSNRKLYIVGADGTNTTQLSLEASSPVSWRINNIISYGHLNIIDLDSAKNIYLVAGSDPQNYSTSEVVYLGSDGVYKIRYDGSSNMKMFSNYLRSTLKLSFDNTKLVGGNLETGGGNWIRGIWVMNVDGTNDKRLR